MLETSQAESVILTMLGAKVSFHKPFLPHLHTEGMLSMWANNTNSARSSPPHTHRVPRAPRPRSQAWELTATLLQPARCS